MSKTPAPKAPPKKKAITGKPARAAASVTPASKKVAAKKAVPARKPASAPARSKPVAAPTVAVKPAATAKRPVMKPAPAPAPAPVIVPATLAVAALVAPKPVTPKKSGRNASKYPAPAVQAPLPPPTSRFADRFAPPRPPTRQMNSNLELDIPRHAQKSDPKLANAWKSKAGRDLTEAEILAMPDSEYMNDKQLEFFRLKLQTLKDDLLSNAGETTEHLREDTSIVPDPADRATIEEEHALELRTRDRERKLLKKISQSLGRIDSGDYGFCDETGEPIGLGRLIARPTATLSLEAQQRRELKQKMFGD
ncbi:MAG TPA: RNA polymerase-binding protein DksA [Burkholderiaceae bacterium]